MIRAKYRGKLVTGNWFLFGDNYWLLLTEAAKMRTGHSAIEMDKLTKISSYPY